MMVLCPSGNFQVSKDKLPLWVSPFTIHKPTIHDTTMNDSCINFISFFASHKQTDGEYSLHHI